MTTGPYLKLNSWDIEYSLCKGILPARQKIDDDKEHRIVGKIIQLWEGGAQLGRFDVCRGYYDLLL